MTKTYIVTANGAVFGPYEADDEQGARNACAQDAGYEDEAGMVFQIEAPSALIAHEAVTIRPDEENAAEVFFDFAREDDGTPDEIMEIADYGMPVVVTQARAYELLAWCEAAPGWNDGPEHARTALLFS